MKDILITCGFAHGWDGYISIKNADICVGKYLDVEMKLKNININKDTHKVSTVYCFPNQIQELLNKKLGCDRTNWYELINKNGFLIVVGNELNINFRI